MLIRIDENFVVTSVLRSSNEDLLGSIKADDQTWIAINDGDAPEQLEGLIGAKYINGGFDLSAAYSIQAPKSAITVISRRQAKQMMFMMGLLDSVQPLIDGIEDATERMMMKIFWEDSQEFERYHPQFIAMAYQLGLTDDEIDEAFIQASQL